MSKKFGVVQTDYGMKLSILGFINPDEVSSMNHEIQALGKKLDDNFGIVVDMRENRAFSNEVAELMKDQIGIAIDVGMARAGIVLQSAIMTLQARRLIAETGIGDRVRFIDASSDADWEKTAIQWAARGVEPVAQTTGVA